ncbi:MAG: UDP-2,4-diacetamido-2,4,6-trideoxy-beta-L-altropyranose hydrolase [Lachnospiraceae bacterium]|nr:UDP-2,4-diacetamido-2,4,6-trideoxy-beta-L-altropyranose hydrolase [Lachnospiraceae bacterium]
MEEKHVLIRADGNAAVAMGHVMRCLTLADALAKQHIRVTFVSADDGSVSVIEERGYSCRVLGTDYAHPEEELPAIRRMIEELEPDLLLADSYYVTPAYFADLRGLCPLALIDDFGEQAFPVDILINFQCYGAEVGYASLYKKAGMPLPKLFTGAQFIPLRSEYATAGKSRREKDVRDVLILTGGSDPLAVAAAIAEALHDERPAAEDAGSKTVQKTRSGNDVCYHFLCGRFSKSLPVLEKLTAIDDHLILHTWTDAFWDFIRDFDLAVTAAGGTVYELCAAALPFIVYTFAKNQWQTAAWLPVHAGIPSAGDVILRKGEAGAVASEGECVDVHAIRDLVDLIHGLEQDPAKRDAIRSSMQTVTDGMGASRLASELATFLEKRA